MKKKSFNSILCRTGAMSMATLTLVAFISCTTYRPGNKDLTYDQSEEKEEEVKPPVEEKKAESKEEPESTSKENFFEVQSVDLGITIPKDYWSKEISYTKFDNGTTAFKSEPGEVQSKREGKYQVIHVKHQHKNFDDGGTDETIYIDIKIDKDYNAAGSLSVERRSHAEAGWSNGMPQHVSTCNMSYVCMFELMPAEVWHGVDLLRFVVKPKIASLKTGGFEAFHANADASSPTFTYSFSDFNSSIADVVIDVHTSTDI